MRLLFISIFMLVIATVQGQVVIEQQRWPNGALRHTEFVQGSRLFFISYYENGSMKEQGCYRNGRQDGTWKHFTEQGAILARANFNNGKPQGVWEFRTDANAPIGRLHFRNGMLMQGEQIGDDGSIAAQRTYR